jgi:hypothetical protein
VVIIFCTKDGFLSDTTPPFALLKEKESLVAITNEAQRSAAISVYLVPFLCSRSAATKNLIILVTKSKFIRSLRRSK